MKSRPTLIVLVLIFIASVVPSATMACWIKLSPQELIEKSDVVLIGDIVGQVDEDEGKRVTYWNVKVYYYLKGDRKSGEFIVGTPGVENKSKIISTDYRLDQWGNTVLLFLRKKEDYYEPLTPQGVVNLKKNEYSRKTGDPINGQLILKQFDIADPKISPEERSEFEKFILKNSLFISPDNVPQATFSPIGLTMEKTVILFLILSFLAVAGLRFARRSKRE